jgi:hypothetical protein
MTIAALKELTPDEASKVLAAAAIATSSNPNENTFEDSLFYGDVADRARAVLDEIRQQLRIKENNTSLKAVKAIDKRLAEEIARATLSGVDTDALLRRIGQAGRLSLKLYNVETTKDFDFVFFKLGIKRKNVVETVKNPDDYQHLLTEGASDLDRDDISIFLRQHPDHWLLVQTHRNGNKQIAQSAWFVYPSDVDLSQASQPIDVLKQFALTFGLPFKVDGVEHKFLQLKELSKGREAKIDFPKGEVFYSVSFRTSSASTAQPVNHIGIVYCIDLAKYRNALIRHGVKLVP